MADGTVRGELTLTSEQALRGLREIRDTGREADRALESLGQRMDRIGMRTVRPHVDLTGIDAANLKLSELEARLDRINRKSYTPHVGISGNIIGIGGGGFSNLATGSPASAGGGGPGGLLGSAGGRMGLLPWWAAAAPLVPMLVGGAGGLISSAGSAALGAGAVGLAGAASLGAGAGFTMAIAKPAIAALGQITKAQDAYTKAVQEFGAQSRQAATAQRSLNQAIVSNPAAAGAARQYGAFRQGWRTATAPATAAIYGGVSNVLYNARQATPTLASSAFGASTATAGAASAFSGFLAQPAEQGMLAQLTGSFAQNLPIAERSLENITTTLGHLSVAALPFFHEANVWVMNWTAGLARSSADQPRVQSGMQRMVDSAKDWARLTGAAARDIRDLFAPAVTPGNSMVQDLTTQLDKWDAWLRANPDKLRTFFRDGVQGTERIASVIGKLAGDLWSIFQALSPILTTAERFLSFASGLGGGSLLTGAAALYAGYGGARRALGGVGPSAGALGLSLLTGSPAAAVRSSAASGVAGSVLPMVEGAAAARYFGAGIGRVRGLAGVGIPRAAGLADATLGEATLGAGVVGARIGAPISTIEAEAGMLSKAGTAIAGAARVAVPVMAALSATTGITAGASAGGSALHGINVGLSSALSSITLGAVKPGTFQQMFGGAPTGADARAGPISQSLAQQAHAVRTPQDLQALQRQVSFMPITFEMSPGNAAKLRQQAQQALSVGAANAGAYASNAWESAFERGIERGVGPDKAVAQMLAGMQSQITQLGPKGGIAFARDTAQWVAQLEAADPRMIKPLEKLMDGIVADINQMNHTVGTSFKDLQSKVFYFNGQILQGSQTTWSAIHDALVNPALKMQEQLSGIWGTIQSEAVDNLTSMGYPRQVATQIVTNLSKGGDWAKIQTTLINANQSGNFSGFSKLSPTAPTGLKHERGGVLGGQGLLDTVALPDGSLAAPGEAWIANRHTMNALSSATIEKYGKTAWQIIRDEQRPHSAPMLQTGGMFGNVAGSIQSVAGGVTNSIARSSGSGWVQRQHPELHPGIAQAVEMVLSRFPLSITSTTRGGHAAGSYHYLGEAADIAGASPTMLQAAGWINSSGLASSLTEGIHNPNLSVKFGRQVSPSFWGGAVWGQHANHIHMAVAGALSALAAAGGGGATMGLVPTVSLRVPRTPARGIPGAFQQQAALLWTNGLSARLNQALGTAAGGISAAGFSGGGSNAANQQLGHRMMLAAGWGEDQWPSLQALWNQESGWSSTIVNPSSGAAGIPQALGHGHPFNLGDAPAQIAWGLNYIRGRYGSPAAAEAHERAFNWYQRGGRVNWAGWNAKGGSFVTNGPTMFGAGEFGNRERVSITPAGRGDGRVIHVNMEHVHLGSGSASELEAVAQDVAGRILDALDRTEGGASDGTLAGVT